MTWKHLALASTCAGAESLEMSLLSHILNVLSYTMSSVWTSTANRLVLSRSWVHRDAYSELLLEYMAREGGVLQNWTVHKREVLQRKKLEANN